MKTYDMVCPICGRINKRLYLEETGGWMECECCGKALNCSFAVDVIQISCSDQSARRSEKALRVLIPEGCDAV